MSRGSFRLWSKYVIWYLEAWRLVDELICRDR